MESEIATFFPFFKKKIVWLRKQIFILISTVINGIA